MSTPVYREFHIYPSVWCLLHLRSRGQQWILFPENLNVICFMAKQNKSKFWKTRWDSGDNIRPPLITCNSGQHFAGNSEMFSFNDVIGFAMLPAHGIWRETVSLLDVMWSWTSQWMGTLLREKRQLYNNTSVFNFRDKLTCSSMSHTISFFFELCLKVMSPANHAPSNFRHENHPDRYFLECYEISGVISYH